MMVTIRWAAAGATLPVTNGTAFSFQSVMTSAKAEGAGAINATATTSRRRLARIYLLLGSRSHWCQKQLPGSAAAIRFSCRGRPRSHRATDRDEIASSQGWHGLSPPPCSQVLPKPSMAGLAPSLELPLVTQLASPQGRGVAREPLQNLQTVLITCVIVSVHANLAEFLQ